jgi:hypothetical protein
MLPSAVSIPAPHAHSTDKGWSRFSKKRCSLVKPKWLTPGSECDLQCDKAIHKLIVSLAKFIETSFATKPQHLFAVASFLTEVCQLKGENIVYVA